MKWEDSPNTIPDAEIRRIFSRIGLGLFLHIALQVAAAYAMMFFADWMWPGILELAWFRTALLLVPPYLVSFPVLMAVWRTIPNRPCAPGKIRTLSAGAYAMLTPACFAGTVALNHISIAIADMLAVAKGGAVENPLESVIESSNVWAGFVMMVLIAPVVEELVFRGLLYRKLSCFGGKAYILASSVLFAASHVNVYQILYAFALGVVFSALTYYTGTIRHSVRLHMAVNLLGGGGTTLVMHYGGELAVGVWGSFLSALLVMGIIAIVWRGLHVCRYWLPYHGGPVNIPRPSVTFLNPGMLLMFLLTVWLTAYNIMA